MGNNVQMEGQPDIVIDADAQAVTTKANAKPIGTAADGETDPMKYTLLLNAKPECASAAYNKVISKFIGMADIEAPLFEQASRAAIDIICVLDTSGSMSGARISLLRKSVRRLVRGVQSKDRIALVEFSNKYQILLELTKMDEKGKEKAKNIVKRLQASGGTHLSGGLLEGLKMVKRRLPSTANEICSILLFTDGEANYGIRDTPGILAAAEQEAGFDKLGKVMPSGDPEKWSVDDVCQWLRYKELDLDELITNIKAMKIDGQILMHDLTEEMMEEDLKVSRLHTSKFLREMEKLRQGEEEKVEAPEAQQLACTINTFGYGSSHNSDLLEKLAERFDGMYYFVKDADAINEGFATCLGGLMSTVATNIKLSITPSNGAKNVKVLNDFVVTTQDETVTVNIGDIQSEEKRHILFEVDLPKVRSQTDADTYCSVKLAYDNTITSKSDIILSLMDLKREKVTAKRDEFVDEQYNRVVAGQALQKADELGRVGQLEQARGILDKAMYNVRSSRSSRSRMSKNLVSDMTETRKGYATQTDYSRWGQNYTKQNRSCLRMERAVVLNDRLNQYSTQSTYMNMSKIQSVSQFNDSCSDDSDEGRVDNVASVNPRRRAFSMRSAPAKRSRNKRSSMNRVPQASVLPPLVQNNARFSARRATNKPNSSQYVNYQEFMNSLMSGTPKTTIAKPAKPESPKISIIPKSGKPESSKKPGEPKMVAFKLPTNAQPGAAIHSRPTQKMEDAKSAEEMRDSRNF